MRDKLPSSVIRGARAMLGWSMLDLAEAADVSVSTVKRLEKDEGSLVSEGMCIAIRRTLEAAGVSFIENDGSGAGLRLKVLDDRPLSPAQ